MGICDDHACTAEKVSLKTLPSSMWRLTRLEDLEVSLARYPAGFEGALRGMSSLVSVKTGNIGCAAEAQKWICALPRLMAAGRLELIGAIDIREDGTT